MQQISKEILLNKSNTGDSVNYYLSLYINETFSLGGIYDEVDNLYDGISQDIGIPQFITGVTDNRLNEVKIMGSNTPYMIGVNGVTNITSDNNGKVISISYTIDGISFNTNLNDNNSTTYSFTSNGIIGTNNFLTKRESLIGIVEPIKVKSYIKIVREEYSVYDNNYRLSSIGSLNDLMKYGSGKVFNIYENS